MLYLHLLDKQNFQILKSAVFCQLQLLLSGFFSIGFSKGKLIIDATCAPADISYPTDLHLLNQGRTKTEIIIDILYEAVKSQFDKKTITYRQIARKEYLKAAKKRRPTCKEIRKAIKKTTEICK